MGSTSVNSVLSVLLCALVFVALTGSAIGQSGSIDDTLPPSIVITASNVHVQQILFAEGQQIYTFNGSAWALTNVSADLYDFRGSLVGHHFFLVDNNGGKATWITYSPSSRVTGKTLVSVPSPFPVSGTPNDSINWLLVQATSNRGTDGFMGAATYVQRIYTHGGLAPTTAGTTGAVFGSNYSALYKFSFTSTR